MQDNYAITKNWAFAALSSIGMLYLACLSILSLRIIPSVIPELRIALEHSNNSCISPTLTNSPDFFAYALISAVLVLLWFKVIKSGLTMARQLRATRLFIANLKLIGTESGAKKVAADLPLVFTAGLLHPQVYFSPVLRQNLSDAEFKTVLAHERAHVLGLDPLRKLCLDFLQYALPYFPGKNSLFSSYEVLAELSADEYAQNELNDKESLIKALAKIFAFGEAQLNLANFGLHNDRISILVGVEEFQTRRLFTYLLGTTVFLLFNLVSLTNPSALSVETHLTERLQSYNNQIAMSAVQPTSCSSKDV